MVGSGLTNIFLISPIKVLGCCKHLEFLFLFLFFLFCFFVFVFVLRKREHEQGTEAEGQGERENLKQAPRSAQSKT